MMSAALLISAGVEQAGKSAGSADLFVEQGKPEVTSFAKSFNERVGESALLQGKKTTKEAPLGLIPASNATALLKKLNAVVASSGEGKEFNHAVAKIAANGKAKNATNYLDGAAQAAGTGSGAKAAVNDSIAQNVAPADSVEESETTKDASPNSSTSSVLLVALQPNDDAAAPSGSTEEGRPLITSTGSVLCQKEMESAGKAKELSSVRKTKISENTSTSKTARKTVEIDGNLVSKPAEAGLRADAETASQAIVGSVGAPPKDDVRTNGNRLSEGIAAKTLVPSGVPSATAGGVVHKEMGGHETKGAAVDTGTAVDSVDGQPVLQKFGGELEKATTVAAATSGGGDSKVQSASGPGMITVHPAAGGIASEVAPLAVVSGNAPGEAVSTKLQVGDGGAHVTGPMVETREPSGLGVIAASTEAIPTMLKATPIALEVGIQDGTHGWLKVRAEMADGGVVNASVSAASSTGQEMLHRELPAIIAYLQQEKVEVNAIDVHTPLAAGAEQRSSTGMDGGGQTSQGGHERGEPQQNIRREMAATPDDALTYQSLHGVDEDGSLLLASYASGGSWLSVRA